MSCVFTSGSFNFLAMIWRRVSKSCRAAVSLVLSPHSTNTHTALSPASSWAATFLRAGDCSALLTKSAVKSHDHIGVIFIVLAG